MMNSRVVLLLLLSIAVGLSACTSPQVKDNVPDEAPVTSGTDQQGDETATYGLNEDGTYAEGFDFVNDPQSPLNDPQSPLAERIVYFDFDSSQIRDEYLDLIAAHGRFVAEHSELGIRLEGHTDERGTREYNVALGENRSKSVRSLMELQGVAADQLEVVSYGEELPIAFGHDEMAWGKNRRVEIVYEAR
jgi:peptidoglycan-associated lipoprotein